MKYTEMEKKWQKKWDETGVFNAEPNDRKKFFIIFAYPGISGFLHVGHMRGFTYADVIARYKRMNNFNVLFPAGFHASGLPSITLAKRIERGDEETINMLRNGGISDKTITELTDPVNVVKYFSRIYIENYWKRFGFSIDYRRSMSTISHGYKKFISWQFKKLNEKKLLIQKPHFAPFCSNCGPVAVDASETDISKGGNAEILDFTLLFFKIDDMIMPASTLRPETVFGVTNMWLNPDVEYVKIKYNNNIWIVSREASVKLGYQKNIEVVGSIKGSELIGKKCVVPIINKEVLILPSDFVDPDIATGVVMSVPAHAPYDYIALEVIKKKDLSSYNISKEELENIKPVSLIKTENDFPAIEVCKKMEIKTLDDREKLEEATNIVYKKEFHSGVLKENCGKYAGLKVSETKEKLQNEFIKKGVADVMFEFSEPVVCRCGEKVVIKIIPEQWFIKYSDTKLTEESKRHAEKMMIKPKEYQNGIMNVLDWFGDRACVRQGNWLGTEFPFEKEWIIEPISDSTLYPMYYIISKYVNSGELKIEDMNEDFFDYVFLGKKGNVQEIAEKIRNEFDYWYPLNINLGGKEHKTVHFPVFLMNHVAVLPEKYWPKGIVAHYWVTQKSGKISKSKGGAEPIPDAAEKYSVDGMRLYYSHIGSSNVDIEWSSDAVMNYKSRMEKIWVLINHLLEFQQEKSTSIDSWLLSRINRKIEKITGAFENYDLRDAANEVFFGIHADVKWYLKRGGSNKKIITEIINKWIRLMCPFTPHTSEEIWEKIGGKGFVSSAEYPLFEKEKIDDVAENSEEFLKNTIDDISEILNVVKIKPNKIVLYTAPGWKRKMFKTAVGLGKNLEMKDLMKEAMKDEDIKMHSKEAPKYAQRLVQEMKKTGFEKQLLDEKNLLINAKNFIEKEFNSKIEVYSADEKCYDPKSRAKNSEVFRPAIYVE
ncbi:MAG: leucine--tRNA ligase [Candidatus Thermoplasmatota archaeon]|nr:leucine--tRNA ligase [Candidatus Thermoplasmatota archaeon]